MFTIIKGDIKKVKAEMKAMSKNVTKLKAELIKKGKKQTNEDALQAIHCEKAQLFLSVGTVVPAYWDDFLLNYQLANDAMKRLKGYRVTLEITSVKHQPRKLIIRYTNGRNKGVLELNELPKDVFEHFEEKLVVTPIGDISQRAM